MKKITALFAMFSFSVFMFSCYTTKNIKIDTLDAKKSKDTEILRVTKTSGEIIEFNKDRPGKIVADKVTGTAVKITKEIELEKEDIKEIKKSKGKISKIITRDGKSYEVFSAFSKERKDKFIIAVAFDTNESVTIPLSQVSLVGIEQLAQGMSLIIGACSLLIVLLMYGLHCVSESWNE